MNQNQKVSYHVTGDHVHLNLGGSHMTLGREHKKYAEVRNLIKENRLNEIEELLLQKDVSLEEYIAGSGLFLSNGALQDSDGMVLPPVLSARLRELKEEGFDVDRLVKFWANLKQNPSLNSREQLFKFLEQNGHPLTDDGCFIAYRGVTPDFKDKHTGTFDNSPGSVCEMPRSEVDDNPNNTCSRGLHVAAWDYARSWSSTTVEVKVDPKDVVSVPTDYNGQKMRVCKFEVIQVCTDKLNQIAYGHNMGSWDAYEEEVEPRFSDDDVEIVVELASEHRLRYTDRAFLAARIGEEVNLPLSDILEILNDNVDNWDVEDDDGDDDDECGDIGCSVCYGGLEEDDDEDDQDGDDCTSANRNDLFWF